MGGRTYSLAEYLQGGGRQSTSVPNGSSPTSTPDRHTNSQLVHPTICGSASADKEGSHQMGSGRINSGITLPSNEHQVLATKRYDTERRTRTSTVVDPSVGPIAKNEHEHAIISRLGIDISDATPLETTSTPSAREPSRASTADVRSSGRGVNAAAMALARAVLTGNALVERSADVATRPAGAHDSLQGTLQSIEHERNYSPPASDSCKPDARRTAAKRPRKRFNDESTPALSERQQLRLALAASLGEDAQPLTKRKKGTVKPTGKKSASSALRKKRTLISDTKRDAKLVDSRITGESAEPARTVRMKMVVENGNQEPVKSEETAQPAPVGEDKGDKVSGVDAQDHVNAKEVDEGCAVPDSRSEVETVKEVPSDSQGSKAQRKAKKPKRIVPKFSGDVSALTERQQMKLALLKSSREGPVEIAAAIPDIPATKRGNKKRKAAKSPKVERTSRLNQPPLEAVVERAAVEEQSDSAQASTTMRLSERQQYLVALRASLVSPRIDEKIAPRPVVRRGKLRRNVAPKSVNKPKLNQQTMPKQKATRKNAGLKSKIRKPARKPSSKPSSKPSTSIRKRGRPSAKKRENAEDVEYVDHSSSESSVDPVEFEDEDSVVDAVAKNAEDEIEVVLHKSTQQRLDYKFWYKNYEPFWDTHVQICDECISYIYGTRYYCRICEKRPNQRDASKSKELRPSKAEMLSLKKEVPEPYDLCAICLGGVTSAEWHNAHDHGRDNIYFENTVGEMFDMDCRHWYPLIETSGFKIRDLIPKRKKLKLGLTNDYVFHPKLRPVKLLHGERANLLEPDQHQPWKMPIAEGIVKPRSELVMSKGMDDVYRLTKHGFVSQFCPKQCAFCRRASTDAFPVDAFVGPYPFAMPDKVAHALRAANRTVGVVAFNDLEDSSRNSIGKRIWADHTSQYPIRVTIGGDLSVSFAISSEDGDSRKGSLSSLDDISYAWVHYSCLLMSRWTGYATATRSRVGLARLTSLKVPNVETDGVEESSEESGGDGDHSEKGISDSEQRLVDYGDSDDNDGETEQQEFRHIEERTETEQRLDLIYHNDIDSIDCTMYFNVVRAIEEAMSSVCCICNEVGASLTCFKYPHSCSSAYHVPCYLKEIEHNRTDIDFIEGRRDGELFWCPQCRAESASSVFEEYACDQCSKQLYESAEDNPHNRQVIENLKRYQLLHARNARPPLPVTEKMSIAGGSKPKQAFLHDALQGMCDRKESVPRFGCTKCLQTTYPWGSYDLCLECFSYRFPSTHNHPPTDFVAFHYSCPLCGAGDRETVDPVSPLTWHLVYGSLVCNACARRVWSAERGTNLEDGDTVVPGPVNSEGDGEVVTTPTSVTTSGGERNRSDGGAVSVQDYLYGASVLTRTACRDIAKPVVPLDMDPDGEVPIVGGHGNSAQETKELMGTRFTTKLSYPTALMTYSYQVTTSYFDLPDRVPRWSVHSASDWGGTWPQQVPRWALLKYSAAHDRVLSNFLGRGTDIIECLHMNRRAVGVDVNELSIALTYGNLARAISKEKQRGRPISSDDLPIVRLGNAMDLAEIGPLFRSESFDLVLSHPPYWNAIVYSSLVTGDVSRAQTLSEFLLDMRSIGKETHRLLKPGKHCLVCMGDTRQHCFIQPCGALTILQYIKAGLVPVELIIKRQRRCEETIKRGRALSARFDFLLLKHEYIAVFQRPPDPVAAIIMRGLLEECSGLEDELSKSSEGWTADVAHVKVSYPTNTLREKHRRKRAKGSVWGYDGDYTDIRKAFEEDYFRIFASTDTEAVIMKIRMSTHLVDPMCICDICKSDYRFVEMSIARSCSNEAGMRGSNSTSALVDNSDSDDDTSSNRQDTEGVNAPEESIEERRQRNLQRNLECLMRLGLLTTEVVEEKATISVYTPDPDMESGTVSSIMHAPGGILVHPPVIPRYQVCGSRDQIAEFCKAYRTAMISTFKSAFDGRVFEPDVCVGIGVRDVLAHVVRDSDSPPMRFVLPFGVCMLEVFEEYIQHINYLTGVSSKTSTVEVDTAESQHGSEEAVSNPGESMHSTASPDHHHNTSDSESDTLPDDDVLRWQLKEIIMCAPKGIERTPEHFDQEVRDLGKGESVKEDPSFLLEPKNPVPIVHSYYYVYKLYAPSPSTSTAEQWKL